MTAYLPRIKARLEIPARRRVHGLIEGEYASAQVGRSLDFNDLRAYVRGDDVRDLDWKASARSGQLLVKRFVATRQHTLLLAVSTGRSMAAVDERLEPKRDLAVFIAGLLGWVALRHGDQVQVAYGDAGGCHLTRPSDREVPLERALASAHGATTTGSAPSDLAALLGYVARVVRRRTILLVVADDRTLDDRTQGLLRRATVQHEVLFLALGDLDPTRAPDRHLVDVESGASLPAWAGADAQLAREYAAVVAAERADVGTALDRLGIASERVGSHDEALTAVYRLLERHRHGRR
jgi:uncharacterized protein (DUF58 family)